MKTELVILIFCALINCLNAEITFSEFIISTNPALYVHDSKLTTQIISDNTSRGNVGREEAIIQDAAVSADVPVPVTTNAQSSPVKQPEVVKAENEVKNVANIQSNNLHEAGAVVPEPDIINCTATLKPDCTTLKPDNPTTTETPTPTTEAPAVPEQVVIVYPETEPPPTVKPENPVDIRLAYFLANNFMGQESRPIIYIPHYIQHRPMWSAIHKRPAYAQWSPFFRNEDPETPQQGNVLSQIPDPSLADDINLTRKEIMKLRLNQLRVSKLLPELHPQPPRQTSIVLDTSKTPEPSPTVQWEIPRKFFQWPTWWPFSLFVGSNSDKPAAKAEPINPIQGPTQAQVQPIALNDASHAAQSQRNLGNQFKINPFLEFGRDWQPY